MDIIIKNLSLRKGSYTEVLSNVRDKEILFINGHKFLVLHVKKDLITIYYKPYKTLILYTDVPEIFLISPEEILVFMVTGN